MSVSESRRDPERETFYDDIRLIRRDVAHADTGGVDRLSLLARLDAALSRAVRSSGSAAQVEVGPGRRPFDPSKVIPQPGSAAQPCGWCEGEGALRDEEGKLGPSCPRCGGRSKLEGGSGSAAQDHEDRRCERCTCDNPERCPRVSRPRSVQHPAETYGLGDERWEQIARAHPRSPQGEDHEGIEAWMYEPAKGINWSTTEGRTEGRRRLYALSDALFSRVSAPERDTVRLVERLRSGLLLIAQDTALSAETHRLMAQDLLTEFPVSGESEDEHHG